MKEKFVIRKLKQLSRKLGHRLVDATVPADIFVELLKYRDSGEATSKSQDHDLLGYMIRHFNESSAQIFQDLWVLFMTREKHDGFFVEFGATNGMTLSNTLLLERDFGWKGILAEPARGWHDELRQNRKCIIDTRCVWSRSGEVLEFNEVAEGELSTIGKFSDSDGHAKSRKLSKTYTVESISLEDLLVAHNAPHCIDYLSVDTEGSELTILSNFDFSKYDIRFITVEHNYTPERKKIHTLLRQNGYTRIFEGFSQWDDWYVKADPVLREPVPN